MYIYLLWIKNVVMRPAMISAETNMVPCSLTHYVNHFQCHFCVVGLFALSVYIYLYLWMLINRLYLVQFNLRHFTGQQQFCFVCYPCQFQQFSPGCFLLALFSFKCPCVVIIARVLGSFLLQIHFKCIFLL